MGNGDLIVSTMGDQVKMFDSQLKFKRPADMTCVRNGDFALKDNSGIQVFNPRGLFVSRVWRSQFPWQCYGLAEDKEGHLWFIDSNRKTGETHLKCYDLKKGGLVK